MRRALFCLVVLFAACGSPAVADDEVELRWRFAAGETFRLLTEADLEGRMTIVEEGGEGEVNRQVERCLYEVRVASVGAGGTALLEVRFLALEVVSEEPQKVMRLRCVRGENGWEPTLTSGGPEEERVRALAILGPILTTLADTPIHLEVTTAGAVVQREISPARDPFASVTQDLDEESRKMLAAIRNLMAIDDAFGTGLALAFTQLPSGAVGPGSTWPVERTFPIARLDAVGRGVGSFVALRTQAGVPVAEIRETLPCTVSAERVARGVEATMVELFRGQDAGPTVDIELISAGHVGFEATTLLDLKRGRATSVAWENVNIPLKGRLAIRFGGQDQRFSVEFLVTGFVRARFGSAADLPALPQSKIARARAQLASFSTAVSLYYLHHRRLPHSLETLAEENEKTGEPFLDRVPPDPWGGDYELRLLDRRRYQLICHGPDGEADTDDDLVWPEPE